MRKGIIIYQQGQEDRIKRLISGYADGQLVVLETDARLPEALKGKNVECRTYEDYLKYEDFLEIDNRASRFATSWYADGPADITLYKGISIGHLIEYPTRVFMIAAFKNAALIGRALKRDRFDFAACVDNGTVPARLFLKYCSDNKIPVQKVKAAKTKGFFEREHLNKRKYLFSNIRGLVTDCLWAVRTSPKNNCPRKAQGIKRLLFEPYMRYHEFARVIYDNENYEILYPRPRIRKQAAAQQNEGFKRARVIYYPRFLGIILPKAGLAYIRSKIFSVVVWRRIAKKAALKRAFAAEGILFWDSIRSNFRNYFNGYFPGPVRDVEAVGKFLSRYKADIVLLPQDEFGINRVFACEAKRLGMSTAIYQHGIINDYPSFIMPVCQKLFVWGRRGENFYFKKGIARESMLTVGNPVVEALKRQKTGAAAPIRERLGIPRDSRVVLFASQPHTGFSSLLQPYYEDHLIARVCETAGSFKEASFIIKLHPWTIIRGQLSEKGKIIGSYGGQNTFLAAPDADVYELLGISDVVITENSTIGLEAMAMDKPVIALYLRNILDADYFQPYRHYEGVIVVRDYNSLAASIRQALYESEAREKLSAGRKRFLDENVSSMAKADGQLY